MIDVDFVVKRLRDLAGEIERYGYGGSTNTEKLLSRLLIIHDEARRGRHDEDFETIAYLTASLLEDEYLALRDPELGALSVELRAKIEKIVREK